jgi:hypothetical protein
MPKILIAVSSCWKDLQSNQAIRDTWAKRLPANWDLRFFLGSRNFTEEEQARLFTPEWIGSPGTLGNLAAPTAKKAVIGKKEDLKNDEIIVDCPDSYLGLPWKTTASLEWAISRDYAGVFRIFVDTYLFPDRLALSDYAHNDAIGWMFGCGPCPAHPDSHHLCPLGGAGYWLSRKACEIVVADEVKHWGEDTFVGYALHKAGIEMKHDFRYVYSEHESPQMNRSKFSIHLNDRGTAWNPQLMLDTHEAQEKGREIWPQWDGTCKRDGSTFIVQHPRGPRCKQCGVFV